MTLEFPAPKALVGIVCLSLSIPAFAETPETDGKASESNDVAEVESAAEQPKPGSEAGAEDDNATTEQSADTPSDEEVPSELPQDADSGDTRSEAKQAPAEKTSSDVPPKDRTKRSDDTKIETMVVTGTKTEQEMDRSAVRTEVVDAATIEVSGAENLAQLLEHFTGVTVTRSFRGSELQINGLAAKYVLILVDGRRQVGDLGNAIDLERFPVSQVERIEILKGAASGLYGSRALGGVVNIITKRSVEPIEGQVRLVGTWGATKERHWPERELPSQYDIAARLGVNGDAWSSDLQFSGYNWEPIRYDPDSFYTTFAQSEGFKVYSNSELDISEFITLKFGADYGRRSNEGQEEGTPRPTPSGIIVEQFEVGTLSESGTGFVNVGMDIGDDSQLRIDSFVQLYRDQYVSVQLNGDKDKYEEQKDLILDTQMQFDTWLNESGQLTVGLQAQQQKLEADRLNSESLSRTTGALFSQYMWQVAGVPGEAGDLSMIPAVRADYDSQFGSHLSPKGALRYSITENHFVRFWTGSGFVAPRFKELGLLFENLNVGYKVLGNPDLTPESSFDAGAQWVATPTEGLRFDVSAYGTLIKDQILTLQCPDEPTSEDPSACSSEEATTARGPVYTYLNIGEGRSLSLEMNAEVDLTKRFKIKAGYVHNDARGFDESTDSWELLPNRSLHSINMDLRYFEPLTGTRTTLRGTWASPRLTGSEDPVTGKRLRTDETFNIDFKVIQFIDERFRVFFQGQNLLNQFDAAYLVVRPRVLSLGMDVSL